MPDARLPPVRSAFKKLVMYETRQKFYIIAYSPLHRAYHVMKIDRDDARSPLQISVVEGGLSREEVYELLDRIHAANVHSGGLIKSVTAVALLGFIQFLQGHYIVFVTKARRVGQIGPHSIYGVVGTALIPILMPAKNTTGSIPTQERAEESRYRALLSNLDLADNFYFSYTYDITRTLQSNMLQPDRGPILHFFWNHFLRSECEGVPAIWFVDVVHGHFEEKSLSFMGRQIVMTLISRRSTQFAGTRYLKRGINLDGCSANDIETEQICYDRDQGEVHDTGLYTSYVQHRASIPLYWTQEPNAMVARPIISIQFADPVVRGMRRHFEGLLKRYGAPIICLNLIRQSEPFPRETRLGPPFRDGVQFLNQFASPDQQIEYIDWDFKKVAKSRTRNVAEELGAIAERILNRTGFFHSSRHEQKQFRQSGICRSNCIDSLDRTNVAQYCIGKCALANQLFNMGLMSRTTFPDGSPIVKLLLEMYERMGDCLALQYGGSQMHRQMKKDKSQNGTSSVPVLYRLRTPAKPKEILVSILRHYQNSFQDKDKQDAYNLFLGVFRPRLCRTCPIWEITSDFYLHNPQPSIAERLLSIDPEPTPRNWTVAPAAQFEARVAVVARAPVLFYSPLELADEYFRECYEADSVTLFDEEFEQNRSLPIAVYPVSEPVSQGGAGMVARLWRNLYFRSNTSNGALLLPAGVDEMQAGGSASQTFTFGLYSYQSGTSRETSDAWDLATSAFRFAYLSCSDTHSLLTSHVSGETFKRQDDERFPGIPASALITGVNLPNRTDVKES